MCRSGADGGRRCPAVTDETLAAMRSPQRRMRDNALQAERARADGRHKDARRFEAHAAKAREQLIEIRNSTPPGPIAKLDQFDVSRARDRKALLASLEAEGVREDSPYKKQFRTVNDWHNEQISIARDAHGRVVGVAGSIVQNRQVTLNDIWVIESAQRTGAGTEMMAAAANLATQVGKYGEVTLHVKNAVADAKPYYEKLGAEFRPGSQGGDWTDQRKIYDLAMKAKFPAVPPKPVISVEEERTNLLDSHAARFRRMSKRDRAAGGKGLLDLEYELDPNGIGSLAQQFPELSRDQLIAEMKARRIRMGI